MVSRAKFEKLNAKQKIYKIANAIRDMEINLSEGILPDIESLRLLLSYLEETNDIAKSIDQSKDILKTIITDIADENDISIIRKSINIAYHSLLALIGKDLSEGFYLERDVNLFDKEGVAEKFDVICILDNVRSPFNVGSIFRSCDCFGFGELALCGITPKPPMKKLERTAMGTIDIVKWIYYENTIEAIKSYRNKGYRITAIETVKDSKSIYEADISGKEAFVFGNEEFGITGDVLASCDRVLYIPMSGTKNSLNVASSFSVIAGEYYRRMHITSYR